MPDISVDAPVDAEVDARGLHCPLPILRAKKALSTLSSGQLLRVLSTDGGAARDFAAFCAQSGHALLAQQVNAAGECIHILRRR